MKKMILIGMMACCMAALSWAADEAAAPAPSGKHIALVTSGEVNSELAQAVRQWMLDNGGVKVVLQEKTVEATGTLEEIARRAVAGLKPDELFMVVLAMPVTSTKTHGISLPSDHVAIINLEALNAGNPEARVFTRRVQQESLRAAAMLIGMAPCPNPQCCLCSFSTVEELDQLGGNYCPPCWIRFEKEAELKGLEALPKSEE